MESQSLSESLTVLTSEKLDRSIDEKSTSYTTLACSLKSVSSKAPIPEGVFNQRNKIINSILLDVTNEEGVAPYALQALGYILFNELVARCIEDELADKIVTALLNVIINEQSTTKHVCTRALWCLANQTLHYSVILPQVSRILDAMKKLISNPVFQTSSMAFETLNVLHKLYCQCKVEFLMMCETWYGILVYTLLSKQVKVQVKALEFAQLTEQSLIVNDDLSTWLHKELRKNVLPYVNSLLSSKTIDASQLMRVWMHFVRILGKALHKSGSFLNEMLKIVEAGFKSRSLIVQLAAYEAWRVLIDDFALDLDLFTNHKRLRLLLMPLVGSAVKQRCAEVDEARVFTWWYLISKLLPVCSQDTKLHVYTEVCVPFLLFCIGLDPKSDLSPLTGPTTNHTHCPTPSKLLSILIEPSKGSSHYPFSPSPSLLTTGCEALLLFLGNNHDYQYTINTGCGSLPLDSYPVTILLSFLIFVEGCVRIDTVARQPIDRLTYQITGNIISLLESTHNNMALSAVCDLIFRVTLSPRQLTDLMCRLSHLVPQLCDLAQGVWSKVLSVGFKLLYSNNLTTQENSDIQQFCSAIINTVTNVGGAGHTHYNTTQQLFDCIVQCMEDPVMSSDYCVGVGDQAPPFWVWSNVVQLFTRFLAISHTTVHNLRGNTDFHTIKSLLVFPFKQGFVQSTQIDFGVFLEVWKILFSTARVYVGLMVKDCDEFNVELMTDLLHILKQFTKSVNVTDIDDVKKCDQYIHSIVSVSWAILDALMPTLQQSSSTTITLPSLLSMCSILKHSLQVITDMTTKVSSVCLPHMKSPSSLLVLLSNIYSLLKTNQEMVKLTQLLAVSLVGVVRAGLTKTRGVSEWGERFLEETVALWRTMCLCFSARYKGEFGSDLLLTLSPLLELFLLCKHEVLMKITVSFWTNTFGKSEELVHPEALRRVLTLFKDTYQDQVLIPIPGFVPIPLGPSATVPTIIDLMAHRVQESEPIIVLPHPPPSPTPTKHNSVSPRKRVVTPSAKSKLGIDQDIADKDYVVIGPSHPKEPRLLTEHQKEKQRERPELPPMYTAIDPSLSTQPFEIEEDESVERMECSVSKSQVIVESPPAPANGREQNNQERENNGTPPSATHCDDTPPQSDSHSTAVPQSDSHSTAVSRSDSHSIESDSHSTAVPQSDSHSVISDPNLVLNTSPSSPTTSTTCTDTQLSTSPIMECTISISPSDAYNILKGATKNSTNTINSPATPVVTMATTDITPPLISTSIQAKLDSCLDSNKPKKRRKRKKATPLSNMASSQSDTNEATPDKPVTRRTRGAGLWAGLRGRTRKRTSINIGNESTGNDRNQPLSKKSRTDSATAITDPVTSITDTATPNTDPTTSVADTATPTLDHTHSSVATPTLHPLPPNVQQALQSLYIEIGKKVATPLQIPNKPHPLVQPSSGVNVSSSFINTLLTTQTQLNAYLKVQTRNLEQMPHTSSPIGVVIPNSLSTNIQTLFSYLSRSSSPPVSPSPSSAGSNVISKSFYENVQLLKEFLESKLPFSVSIDVPSFSSPWQQPVPGSSKTTANINTNSDTEDPLPAKKRKKTNDEENKNSNDKAVMDTSVATYDTMPIVVQQNVTVCPPNIANTDNVMDCDDVTIVNTSDKVDVAKPNNEGTVGGCGTATLTINEKEIVPNQPPSLIPTLATLALAVVESHKTDTGTTPTVLQPLIQRIRSAHMIEEGSLPNTPSQDSNSSSPRTTPIGILKKNTGQLDTPLSTGKGRRVQFASPIVMGKQEAPPTPASEKGLRFIKNARSKRMHTLSSRRTLQLTGPAASNSGSVNTTPPPHGKAGAGGNSEIVFPSLKLCQSPVEQILPALSPSGKFTHGLYNVVHARNISTVGNLSSLTEHEVLSLPIKSPKVPVLRNALRNFEIKMLQGQRKRPSSTSKDDILSMNKPQQQLAVAGSSQEESEDPLITLDTPDSQVTSLDVSNPSVEPDNAGISNERVDNTGHTACEQSDCSVTQGSEMHVHVEQSNVHVSVSDIPSTGEEDGDQLQSSNEAVSTDTNNPTHAPCTADRDNVEQLDPTVTATSETNDVEDNDSDAMDTDITPIPKPPNNEASTTSMALPIEKNHDTNPQLDELSPMDIHDNTITDDHNDEALIDTSSPELPPIIRDSASRTLPFSTKGNYVIAQLVSKPIFGRQVMDSVTPSVTCQIIANECNTAELTTITHNDIEVKLDDVAEENEGEDKEDNDNDNIEKGLSSFATCSNDPSLVDNLAAHSDELTFPVVSFPALCDHTYSQFICPSPPSESVPSSDCSNFIDSQDLFSPTSNESSEAVLIPEGAKDDTSPVPNTSSGSNLPIKEVQAPILPPIPSCSYTEPSVFVGHLTNMLDQLRNPSFMKQFDKRELSGVYERCRDLMTDMYYMEH